MLNMKICNCIVTYFFNASKTELKSTYYGGHSACRGMKNGHIKVDKTTRTELKCKKTWNPFKWFFNA